MRARLAANRCQARATAVEAAQPKVPDVVLALVIVVGETQAPALRNSGKPVLGA